VVVISTSTIGSTRSNLPIFQTKAFTITFTDTKAYAPPHGNPLALLVETASYFFRNPSLVCSTRPSAMSFSRMASVLRSVMKAGACGVSA
jgi:hypothetical protein